MPKGRPNSYAGGGFIQSMREKHEPHMKLAGKVESLEKNIPIEIAEIHKTISKSFGMQRKTLTRVLGLENRVSNVETGVEIWTARESLRRQQEAEQAAEKAAEQAAKEAAKEAEQAAKEAEQAAQEVIEEVVETIEEVEEVIEEEYGEIPEGLDDVLDDIREGNIGGEGGGEGVSGELDGNEGSGTPGVSTKIDPSKTTPKKKKPKAKKKRPRIKIRKSKIKAADIKKGTPLDEGYASRVMGLDEKGEYLSKEERIRRFKGGALAKPDELKPDVAEPAAAEVDSEKSQEGLLPILKSISSSVDGIKETLIGQAEVSKDQTEFLRKQQENKKRNKRESGLEKMMGGIKKVGQMALKPVMGIWDKIVNFLTAILFGSTVVKLWEWFSDPTNKDKVSSLFKFIKDWWPLLVAGIMAFIGPGVTFTVGAIALLSWGIPKIIDAVKSIFGFGKKIDKELVKGEADSLKDGKKFDDLDIPDIIPRADDYVHYGPEKGIGKGFSQQEENKKMDKMMEVKNFNKGGEVPGTGDKDTVPAMLTPGEFVMSKGAVQEYGVDTLAGMNAAAGGTNIPTLQKKDKKGGKGGKVGSGLIPRYNEGGKVQTMSEKLGHTRGTVTDPEEKKQQENYMLEWVNKERVEVLGLPPLKKLTYADGVELTKKMGPGPKVTETSDTHLDFDNMMKTTTRSKTVGDKTIFSGSIGLLTEEDKQQYLASNPGARMMLEIKDQMELDALGADISASARMNGGGLVPAFNGGGLVQGYHGGGLIRGLGKLIKRSRGVGGSIINNALKMSGVQNVGSNIAPPGTPGGGRVKVVAIPGGVPGGATPPADNSGKKIPAFSASAKNSQRKIKTLGISL